MRAYEFITEWVKKGESGPFKWGIGVHFMDQWKLPDRKDITWNQINHILSRLPYIKPQLMQMKHFKEFWIRDDESGVELGCELKTFGDPETRFVYVNTLVMQPKPRIKPIKPVISITKPQKSKIQESRFRLNEVGLNHAEDIIFWEGSAGAIRVINSFKSLSKRKDEILSLKWDGQVAIFAGRDENGTFIMTDMSGWGAKGYNGLYTSAKEFIAQKQSKGGNPEFLAKIKSLWPLMESVFPSNYKGFVKGDVMWWPGTLKQNATKYIFGEGTTTYEIDKNSDLGKRVGRGEAGFAVHGYCESTSDKTPMALKSTAGLNTNTKLCVLGPEIKAEGNLQLGKEQIANALAIVKNNKNLIDSFLDISTLQAMKMTGLSDILYTFVNQQTRIRDLENLSAKFIPWVQNNPKLSTPMVAKICEYVSKNSKGLAAIFQVFDVITSLKLDIIHQLDSQSGPVYAHIKGVRGGEGYVASDEGGPLKLVNRSHFSASNFGNH